MNVLVATTQFCCLCVSYWSSLLYLCWPSTGDCGLSLEAASGSRLIPHGKCAWGYPGKTGFCSTSAHFKEIGRLFNTWWAAVLWPTETSTQRVSGGPGTWASPGNLLEMQNPSHTPSSRNRVCIFKRASGKDLFAHKKLLETHVHAYMRMFCTFTSMGKGHPWPTWVKHSALHLCGPQQAAKLLWVLVCLLVDEEV